MQIQIQKPIKYDEERGNNIVRVMRKAISILIFKKFFFTTASFGLIMNCNRCVCVAMCTALHSFHSFFFTLILFIIFIFTVCWTTKCDSLKEEEEENSTAMECTHSKLQKNWYYFIGLEKERTNMYEYVYFHNGKFTWKCLRLVIIQNQDHFLSFFLSPLSHSLSFFMPKHLFFFINNRVQFQIMMKLKTICGFVFEPFVPIAQVIPCGWFEWKNLFQKLCITKIIAFFGSKKSMESLHSSSNSNSNNVLETLNAYAVFLLKKPEKAFKHDLVWIS